MVRMLSCVFVLLFRCLLLLFVLLISTSQLVFSAAASPLPPLLISTFISVQGRTAQRMNNTFRLLFGMFSAVLTCHSLLSYHRDRHLKHLK